MPRLRSDRIAELLKRLALNRPQQQPFHFTLHNIFWLILAALLFLAMWKMHYRP
jgi:hypothetical protein